MANGYSTSTTDHSAEEGHVVPMVWYSCMLAALAGLLFGLDIGVISGALPFIKNDFNVDDRILEWVVSSMMLGAAIGALGSGYLSQHLGRKYSLLLGAVLFVLGSLVCAFAADTTWLIIGRLILGLAVGIASFAAPLYLSEVAPEKIRGSMISLYQLMITVGILAAFLSNTAFSYTGSWRWMLGVITFPAIILFLGTLALPTSPRWLASKERFAEAEEVLQRLRSGPREVAREMEEIKESVAVKSNGWQLWRSNRNFRRSVGMGVALQIVQQFTGMNAVMYYAPRIFEEANFASTEAQLWSTVCVGVVNVLATFIAILCVDKWGRRPILFTGFTIMAAGMACLGLLLHLGVETTVQQYTAVAVLLIFIAGFAMSAGPLIWILCSEIQPLKGRDFGIACSTVTNWVANMIIGATFLTVLNALGGPKTFWVFAVLNVIFLIFTARMVPETKDISLERIEHNLMSGKPMRQIGR